MPFSRQKSVRDLLRSVSMNLMAKEDDSVDVGPSLLLATMRTDSKTITRSITTSDLTDDDVIVLLMGPSNSGKSTFIEIAGGIKGLARPNGSKPRTTDISLFRVSAAKFPDSNIVLVDTPAFNDTDKPDIEILTMLSDWLNETYATGIRLSGLIYFHRISDQKMEGTPLRNWRVFEKFCGEGFNKVVLATTMWDDVDGEEGHDRERELEDFWRPNIDRGSSMKRFLHDRATATEVLSPILENITRMPLRIQREFTDFDMTLKETTAARVLFQELEVLSRDCKRNLLKIRDDLNNPSLDKQELSNLEKEYRKASALLKRVTAGLADLRVAPAERLRRFTLMTKSILIQRFPALGHLGTTMRKWPEPLGQMDGRGDEDVPATRWSPRSDVIVEEEAYTSHLGQPSRVQTVPQSRARPDFGVVFASGPARQPSIATQWSPRSDVNYTSHLGQRPRMVQTVPSFENHLDDFRSHSPRPDFGVGFPSGPAGQPFRATQWSQRRPGTATNSPDSSEFRKPPRRLSK